MATTRAKVVMLLTALLTAVAVYGVMKVTEYFSKCVTIDEYTDWRAAPFFVTAVINSLTRYDRPYCQQPVYTFSADKVWLGIEVRGYNQYYLLTGRCATTNDPVSASPDPYYAVRFRIVMINSCTSARSYYVYGHYVAYYN